MANLYDLETTEKPMLLIAIQYRIILANSTVKQCKDRSRLLLHIPLISISKQEKRNGTLIQTPNFPYTITFPCWTRLLTPLLSQHTNSGPTSRKSIPNQRIPEQSKSNPQKFQSLILKKKNYTFYARREGEEYYLITDNRTKRMSEKCSLSSAGVNNWFLKRTKNRQRTNCSSVGAS